MRYHLTYSYTFCCYAWLCRLGIHCAHVVGAYADAQFEVADIDTLCGFLAESFIDQDERARAAEFLHRESRVCLVVARIASTTNTGTRSSAHTGCQ